MPSKEIIIVDLPSVWDFPYMLFDIVAFYESEHGLTAGVYPHYCHQLDFFIFCIELTREVRNKYQNLIFYHISHFVGFISDVWSFLI